MEVLTNNIFNTAKQTFKLSNGYINPKFNKPWWSPECAQASSLRKQAHRRASKYLTHINIKTYRNLAINAKEIIKNAKIKSKIEFINTINSESNIATVWNNINWFRGSYHPTSTPLITPTAIVTVAKQKTQLFADKFETVFKCTGGIARADGEDGRVATDMGGDHILEYNCPFEKNELVSVLVNLKGTSSGVDLIHNEFLKH